MILNIVTAPAVLSCKTMTNKTRSEQLSFGTETLILTRRWGHETRLVAIQLLDEDRALADIGEAVGRDPMDVLNFATRCAPKLRALEPDTRRVRVRMEETRR